jgi:hypothetical protein
MNRLLLCVFAHLPELFFPPNADDDFPEPKLPGRRGPRDPAASVASATSVCSRFAFDSVFSQCLRGSVVKTLIVAAVPRGASVVNITRPPTHATLSFGALCP